uniref:Uncharacterized protein n=1 Tax=Solanum lycopersicum TaxID=4081 RepID=A0A494G8Y2_SOLLC
MGLPWRCHLEPHNDARDGKHPQRITSWTSEAGLPPPGKNHIPRPRYVGTWPRNVLDMSKRSLWSHFTQKNRKIGLEVHLTWTSVKQPMCLLLYAELALQHTAGGIAPFFMIAGMNLTATTTAVTSRASRMQLSLAVEAVVDLLQDTATTTPQPPQQRPRHP